MFDFLSVWFLECLVSGHLLSSHLFLKSASATDHKSGMRMQDLARFGQVWLGLARFGQVWLGLARFGQREWSEV